MYSLTIDKRRLPCFDTFGEYGSNGFLQCQRNIAATTAAILTGVIGAGGSTAGALISKSGANAAAETQAAAANAATAETRRQNEQARADLSPYRSSGELSIAKLNELLGLGGNQVADPYLSERQNLQKKISDLEAIDYTGGKAPKSPQEIWADNYKYGSARAADQKQIQEYKNQLQQIPAAPAVGTTVSQGSQFGLLNQETPAFVAPNYQSILKDPTYLARVAEGTRQVEGSAAARAGTLNGAAIREMLNYNQTMASDEMNNIFNRDMSTYRTNTDVANSDKANLFARLQTLASMGENAAGQTAQLGTASSNQVAGNILSAGNATSAGQVASGNILGGIVSNAGTTLADILNNSRQSSYINPWNKKNAIDMGNQANAFFNA